MNEAILQSHGIDSRKGIVRCMDDPAFYERFLRMFLGDGSFAQGKAALDAGDVSGLFRSMHELKGVSGNAELSELYQAVCPLVDALRQGGVPVQEAAVLFRPVETAYLRAIEGIRLALGDA